VLCLSVSAAGVPYIAFILLRVKYCVSTHVEERFALLSRSYLDSAASLHS